MIIHCLHGFLGSPHDWNLFETAERFTPDARLVKPDLFGTDSFPETESLAAWGESYARREAERRRQNPIPSPHYLMGYSLGGRLALHVAAHDPSLWDGLIIVGANPGLESADARADRRRNDEVWAHRFESEPWDALLAAWDAQPVFAGKPAPFARPERAHSRPALASALRRWSLGAQMPLWNTLQTLPCPVLWVAGTEDKAQGSICKRIETVVPPAQIWLAPDAGHCVPWEQPHAFASRVQEFIKFSDIKSLEY